MAHRWIYLLSGPLQKKCADPLFILLIDLTLKSLKIFQSPGLSLALSVYTQISVLCIAVPHICRREHVNHMFC